MSGWQPIETAPKDGTRFLVARIGEHVGCHEIEIANWCVMERFHYEEVAAGLFRRVDEKPDEFWNGNGHRATHWMPLPEPPQ